MALKYIFLTAIVTTQKYLYYDSALSHVNALYGYGCSLKTETKGKGFSNYNHRKKNHTQAVHLITEINNDLPSMLMHGSALNILTFHCYIVALWQLTDKKGCTATPLSAQVWHTLTDIKSIIVRAYTVQVIMTLL